MKKSIYLILASDEGIKYGEIGLKLADKLSWKNGIAKVANSLGTCNAIKSNYSIGDCYLAAAGIPQADLENTTKAAKFSIEAMELLKNYDTGDGTILNFRCGVDCGPVVAGVIGEHKFIYDIWGDTVNTAARMEEYGEPGRIQVTSRFREKLEIRNEKLGIKFEERSEVEIKGKGKMRTFFLIRG